MIDQLSLDALLDLVIGDSPLTPRQTGPQLINWFNGYGFNDNYTNGLPPDNTSRKKYARERVGIINAERDMKKFLESIVDARRFVNEPNLTITGAVDVINAIIANDRLVLLDVNGVYKLCNSDGTGEVGTIAIFEDIQEAILNEINSAQILIWVAVAWFTDEKLYNALVYKRKSGVDVKVILIDDEINRKAGINFDKGFRTKWIGANGNHGNIMHHKFCIFDLKKVIHGSYNWTKKARYNNESVAITESRSFAEDFAHQFVELSANQN